MSSARVDSPLLTEFRRHPSPCVPTMPKPRACRKLFPVDHSETNRFLQTEMAKMEAEEKAKIGFDFGRYIPLENQNSSKYTDWEAMEAESVPSFYRETIARSKPTVRRRPIPVAFSSVSPPHQNKDDESFRRTRHSFSATTDRLPSEKRTLDTGRARSFLPVHRKGVQPESSTTNSAFFGTPKPCPEETSRSVLGITGTASREPCSSTRACQQPRDNIGQAMRTSTTTSEPVVNKSKHSETQSRMTGE